MVEIGKEISTIEDKTLKKLAKKADNAGDKDGVLSAAELSVFIDNARKKNIAAESIMQIINEVGVDPNDEVMAKKIKELEAVGKEIKSIENKKLRAAAKEADRNGLCNGVLDAAELNVFMQYALGKSDVTADEIKEIVNEVGIDQNDEATVKKYAKLEEIDNLEKRRDELENQIDGLYGQLYDMPDAGEHRKNKIVLGVGTGTTAALFGTGVALACVPGANLVGLGLIIGGFITGNGTIAGCMIKHKPKTEQEKQEAAQREKFEQENIKPLNDELKKINIELDKLYQNFYEE